MTTSFSLLQLRPGFLLLRFYSDPVDCTRQPVVRLYCRCSTHLCPKQLCEPWRLSQSIRREVRFNSKKPIHQFPFPFYRVRVQSRSKNCNPSPSAVALVLRISEGQHAVAQSGPPSRQSNALTSCLRCLPSFSLSFRDPVTCCQEYILGYFLRVPHADIPGFHNVKIKYSVLRGSCTGVYLLWKQHTSSRSPPTHSITECREYGTERALTIKHEEREKTTRWFSCSYHLICSV